MPNEIIPYLEMCQRETVSLQRGMNYELGGNYSVILMSVRSNAPYRDRFEDDGTILIYEGHDVPRSREFPNPKAVAQPETTPGGQLTQNGLFHRAAQRYKMGRRQPERVRVYEKIRQGIWSYNGVFHLVDSWCETIEGGSVFKFKLLAVEGEEDFDQPISKQPRTRRVIPTVVKLEVWKRDGGSAPSVEPPKTGTSTTSFPGREVGHPLRRRTSNSFVEGTIWRSTTVSSSSGMNKVRLGIRVLECKLLSLPGKYAFTIRATSIS